MGKIVNQTELTEFLGKTQKTIWEWARDNADFPIAERGEVGEAHKYDTEAVIAWLITREVEKIRKVSPKDRLATLQGDVLQIQLAKDRSELVPFAEVQPVWMARVLSAAAFLSREHSRLASMLEATPGVEAKRELLQDTFAEFLTRLGTNGKRMQGELEGLLEKLPAGEVDACMARISQP